MAAEFDNNIGIGEESKNLFKSSGVWMRTYAIILMVMLGLMAIVFLILATDKNGQLVNQLIQNGQALGGFFYEIFGAMLAFFFLVLVFMIYGSIKLLNSSNNFTAISYHASGENFTKAFKNLKIFWMLYGITIITVVIFVIYMVVRLIAFAEKMNIH